MKNEREGLLALSKGIDALNQISSEIITAHIAVDASRVIRVLSDTIGILMDARNFFETKYPAPKATRTIKQIARDSSGIIHALCSDGNLWVRYSPHTSWEPLEDIPQPELESEDL